MVDHASHDEIKVGSERSFGIVFAIVFIVIATLPLTSGSPIRAWSLVVAGVFLALAMIYPVALKPLNLVWFKFGMLLAAIIQPIVMALIYYLVITPIGLIMRTLGKDLLNQKLQDEQSSYWINRDRKKHPMGSMKDQF